MSTLLGRFPKREARIFVALLLVASLARCTAVPVETQTLPTPILLPPLEQTFKGAIDIVGKQIPLPSGTYTLSGTRIQANQKGGYNVSLMLLNVNKDKRVASAVELFTNLRLRRKDDAASPTTPRHRLHRRRRDNDKTYLATVP